MTRVFVRAAVIAKDGRVFPGATHLQARESAKYAGFEKFADVQDGFITADDEFVGYQAAFDDEAAVFARGASRNPEARGVP